MSDEGQERSYDFFDALRKSLADDEPASPLSLQAERVETREHSTIIRLQSAAERAGQTPQTYRLMHLVGALGFTRSGMDTEVIALDQSKAALLAQHHFNNRLSSVVPNLPELLRQEDGRDCDLRLTMDFYDTERNPRVAVTKLLEDVGSRPFPFQMSAMVGATRSAVSRPLAILNAARKIPQVSYASTSTEFDDRGPFATFGRVIPTNSANAYAAMAYLASVTHTTHLGILYVDDEYGASYRLELERIAKQNGIVTASKGIDASQKLTDDLRNSMVKAASFLSQTGYRHFMGILFTHQFEFLLEIGTQWGIMGSDHFWLVGDGVHKGTIKQLTYPSGSPQATALQGTGILTIGEPRSRGSFDRFLRAFEREDEREDFRQYWASKSPLATNAVQFNADYQTDKPGDFSELAYDAVMSLGIAGCRANTTFFTSQQLYNEFTLSSFSGASGEVLIDPITGARVPASVNFVVSNVRVQPDFDDSSVTTTELVVTSEFEHKGSGQGKEILGEWVAPEGVVFRYADLSMTPPPSLPPLEVPDILDPTSFGVVVALAFVVMLGSIYFAWWTWKRRKAHVIRASQPTFLLVICFGEFLMAFSVVMLGGASPPHNLWWAQLSCMPAVWVFSVGFSLVFSALFAKTWRINKILGSANRFTRVTVTRHDAAQVGGFLVLGCLTMTGLWQAIDPLEYKPEFDQSGSLDRFKRPVDVESTCTTEHGLGLYFAISLWSIIGMTVLAANFQAYKARHYTTEYSESIYIGWSMAISLQGIVLSIPVFVVNSDARSKFIARSAVLLLIASSTLFLIFIPKVFYHIDHVKHEKDKAERRAIRLKFQTTGTANLITADPEENMDSTQVLATVAAELWTHNLVANGVVDTDVELESDIFGSRLMHNFSNNCLVDLFGSGQTGRVGHRKYCGAEVAVLGNSNRSNATAKAERGQSANLEEKEMDESPADLPTSRSAESTVDESHESRQHGPMLSKSHKYDSFQLASFTFEAEEEEDSRLAWKPFADKILQEHDASLRQNQKSGEVRDGLDKLAHETELEQKTNDSLPDSVQHKGAISVGYGTSDMTADQLDAAVGQNTSVDSLKFESHAPEGVLVESSSTSENTSHEMISTIVVEEASNKGGIEERPSDITEDVHLSASMHASLDGPNAEEEIVFFGSPGKNRVAASCDGAEFQESSTRNDDTSGYDSDTYRSSDLRFEDLRAHLSDRLSRGLSQRGE